LVLGTSLTVQGGIKALNQQSGHQETLDGIFDLNLSADYMFSRRFSAFVIGKNIFSKEYELYLNYPSRGFTAIAGITYSF
jgi:outer membrane receptor protein involved in Fe transport